MTHATDPDQHYLEAARQFGGAMQRLARATEANPEHRRDLLQDMHVELWRSLAGFDGRCSLKSWVFRVVHNVAASHVGRERKHNARAAPLDEARAVSSSVSVAQDAENNDALDRLNVFIRKLGPPDRQIITLYLEEMDAAAIAEITGLTAGAVATRISRIKSRLKSEYRETENV
ncbi:MAG: RNA polymerase subunit sigma-24 [Hirschia sp.]|mgnify:CR=1 FL=1|nr:RNA polymerase subunit sigma-24 [Hirschia sp.]MBF20070.1 RNA polymerase subunit sigma-24 [Hirschia sp.]